MFDDIKKVNDSIGEKAGLVTQVRVENTDFVEFQHFLTCWFPRVDKRLVPTTPLVARFRLWTTIVKPKVVVESNAIVFSL